MTRRDILMGSASPVTYPAVDFGNMQERWARAQARVSHHIRWGGGLIMPDGSYEPL
jgi:hypothetical protein